MRIRPDDIWLLLVQGFAKHVEVYGEALRERLVAHAGAVHLTVQRDDFVRGSKENDWNAVVPAFAASLREHIGPRHSLLTADFSTTTALDRLLGRVSLMDVMQSYVGYAVWTLCGIPRITLAGTPEDWRSLRARARAFAAFDLDWWCDALDPVLGHFENAANGQVDRSVWRSFYKWNEASGGPQVSGWVNVFFPYARSHGQPSDGDQGEARPNPYAERWNRLPGEGTPTADIPGGLRAVPVQWNYLGTSIPLEFVGGFVGAQQDPDGTVAPHLGWGVLDLS